MFKAHACRTPYTLPLVALLPALLVLETLITGVRSAPELCSVVTGSTAQLIDQDCVVSALPAGNVSIKGRLGTFGGPPALVAASAQAALQGPTALKLEYVLLSGFQLPPPTDPAGFIPVGLGSTSATAVLRDVRILVDSTTIQQYSQYFSALPAVRVYTDGVSFLHVNWHATARASWQSVGLLLATDLQDARATSQPNTSYSGTGSSNPTGTPGSSTASQALRKYSYVLSATNSTLVPLMQELGAITSTAAMLIYVESNVTLSKPPVPQTGIMVNRPCVLVGLVSTNTSVDLHMTINSIILTAPHSNITLDSLAIENMAPGDSKSAEVARPLSVSSANNFWALYYDRNTSRLLMKNCTCVIGSQTDLDYYLYWATVYHSPLPYFQEMAKFVREVIRMSQWQLADAGLDGKGVIVVNSVAGSCTVEDSLYTITPVVAPRLPSPPLDPRLQLQQSQKSPLVTAVTTTSAFREQLDPLGSSEQGRKHIILLRADITLSSEAATIDNNNSSSSSTTHAHNTTVPLGGILVPGQLTLLGDLGEADHDTAVLHLGWRRDLLSLPENADAEHLQVQHLVLGGLAQGPGAAAATALDSPDVWTILMWSVKRTTAASISLSACALELPPAEFDQLSKLAAEGSGQIILKLARDMRGSGDGLLVLNDVSSSNSNGSSILRVGSMTGHGLTCSNVTLLSTAAATAAPAGYFWPGGQVHSVVAAASAQAMRPALAAAIAICVAVFIGLAVVSAFLVVRWHRRRHQHEDVEKAQLGRYEDQLMPQHRRSSGESIGGVCATLVTEPCSKESFVCHASMQHQQQQKLIESGMAGQYRNTEPHGCTGSGGGSTSTADSTLRLTSPDWKAAQEAAEAAGCCLLEPPTPAAAVEISQQQAHRDTATLQQVDAPQQQRPAAPPFINSQTLFMSLDSATALAAAAENLLHKAQHGPVVVDRTVLPSAAASAPGQTCSDSVSSTGLTSAQKFLQKQQERQAGSRPEIAEGVNVNAADGAAAAAGPIVARSSVALSTTASASKPWQRVSNAISLLQHDITVRRLEAGLADSRAGSVASGGATTSGSNTLPGTAPSGSSDGADNTAQQQQRHCMAQQQVQLLDMIGRGSFASVYRGVWRGRCVAVKVVHLPGEAADKSSCGDLAAALQTRERMAVMEAVVSITMSHPNIVQVFTFALKPLPTALAAAGSCEAADQQQQQAAAQDQQMQLQLSEKSSGWELQLVMEYCEEGSLRQVLNQGRVTDPATGLPALPLVLALAHDVACAMLHLHSEHLIHADLKASNVLLRKGTASIVSAASSGTTTAAQSCGDAAAGEQHAADSDGRSRTSCIALLEAAQAKEGGRLIAKVADFGLSLSLKPGDTHVSHMHAGTLTHMAPELLLDGRASIASDVYAFGILLWELLTGRRAFLGVPVALLGHNVVHLRWRPGWPDGIPEPLKLLVEQCWAQEASARPNFQDILARLEMLMQLSPQELLNANCRSTDSTNTAQQNQHDMAACDEAAAAGVLPMQMPGQQALNSAAAGAPGDDLTGAWSLPGGGAMRHMPS